MNPSPSHREFAALVQGFFGVRLVQQRNASARTVASYRDTFRLLLGYFEQVHQKRPTALAMADLDAPAITAFLDYLAIPMKRFAPPIMTSLSRDEMAALAAPNGSTWSGQRDERCLP